MSITHEEKEILLFKLQEELLSWGKKRFWLVLLVVTVIGYFGIRSMIASAITDAVNQKLETFEENFETEVVAAKAAIDDLLKELKQEIREMNKATVKTQQEGELARTTAVGMETRLRDLMSRVIDLQQKKEHLDSDLSSIQSGIHEFTIISKQTSDSLNSELDGLSFRISDLSGEMTAINDHIGEELELKIKNLKTRLRLIETQIDSLEKRGLVNEQKQDKKIILASEKKIAQFESNSRYSVIIFAQDPVKSEADSLRRILTKLGYKASRKRVDPREAQTLRRYGRFILVYHKNLKRKAKELKDDLGGNFISLSFGGNTEPTIFNSFNQPDELTLFTKQFLRIGSRFAIYILE